MVYTITLSAQGGTVSNTSLEVEILRDPPVATKLNNKLQGWRTSASGGSRIEFPYVPTANATIYAEWLPEYTVAFEVSGGTAISNVVAGYIESAPESEKDNYFLTGWSLSEGGDLISFPYTVTSNTTLYASWEVQPLPDTTTFYEPNPDTRNQAEENRLVNKSLTPFPEPFLSGLKLAEDIEINGLVLNRLDTSNNVVWVVSDIDGWWNLPEPQLPELTRGWGDGSYDAIGRFTDRIITLTGSFLPSDPSYAANARAQLLEAVNLVKTQSGGWLIVDEPGGARAANVRLNGRPDIASVNARGRHDFSIGLKAADPIKYEWYEDSPSGDGTREVSIASGSMANVFNYGDAPVPVIFEITGGVTADTTNTATILNSTTGDSINLVAEVIGSETVEGFDIERTIQIDTLEREILVVTNSTEVANTLNTSETVVSGRSKASVLVDWIYLEPGLNQIEFEDFSNASSTAECKVIWRSGWLF